MMQLTTILFSGLGLIALASGAPTNVGKPGSATGPLTYWQDTQRQKHQNEGKDVIRCETTARACITLDPRQANCFHHDNGAACVDVSTPPVPKVPVSAPAAKLATRAASSEKNEHNECSKDRTGILICRYSFCSTDYYCKAGDECKDGSFICAPKYPSLEHVKFEVRFVAPQPENATIDPDEEPSYICSRDRASVLKCLYDFCSTDYYCAKDHPCIDNPARCKRGLSAQSEQ